MKKTKSFQQFLLKKLKSPKQAADYLNMALQEGDFQFLLAAIRDVAEAQGGMSKLSRKTKMNRANLYKMLSKKGHPYFDSVDHVLKACGLELIVKESSHKSHHRAA